MASRRDAEVELQEEAVTATRVAHRGAAVIHPPCRVWFDVNYRGRDGDWVGSTICCPVEERELLHEILGEWLDAFRWAEAGDHRLEEDGLPETRLTFCPCESETTEDDLSSVSGLWSRSGPAPPQARSRGRPNACRAILTRGMGGAQ